MSQNQVGQVYEGEVYLQVWSNGVLSKEMVGPLDATTLKIKPESEVRPRLSKRRGRWGKKAGSFPMAKPTQFTLGVNGANITLLAMAYLGKTQAQSIGSGSFTAEPITLPHDVFVSVGQRNLSAVSITGSALGTDFLVAPKIGAIKALSTGNIADGAVTTFDATYGAITATTILGGAESKIEVQLVMDGQNKEDLSEVYIKIPKIPLTLESDIDLQADDYSDITFTGEMELLSTETAEFYIDNNVKFT